MRCDAPPFTSWEAADIPLSDCLHLLKAFRCWGINTAPIASLMAKKPYVWKRKVSLHLHS